VSETKPLWTLLSKFIQSHIQSNYSNCVLTSRNTFYIDLKVGMAGIDSEA